MPQFKGKLTLLNKLYEINPLSIEETLNAQMIPGHKMRLLTADRIQRRMYIKKCHEPETEYHMRTYFLKAHTFLDIGANVGYFSMMAKAINANIKVYSFEPNPTNFQQLLINIEENNFSDIHVNSNCISDYIGTVSFSIPPINESGWGRITNENINANNFTKINSNSLTLDSLDAENFFHIKPPLFIKIDVEGNELRVLKGAISFIKKYQPIICIELNEPILNDCKTSSSEIIRFMKELNYSCYFINDKKLTQTNIAIEDYTNLNYWFIKDL